MNFVVILRALAIFLASLAATQAIAKDAPLPKVAGPWTQLRKSPLFEAPLERLASTWGPSIPAGTEFVIEKAYGRWLYGHPLPLRNMKRKDYAPNGWVYSRMLVPENDGAILSAKQFETFQLGIYYSHTLGFKAPLLMEFLESMVLSRRTLAVFRNQDEVTKLELPSLFSSAWGADKGDPELGLSGTDLEFLRQEVKVVQQEKKKAEKVRISKILKAPKVKPLDDGLRRVVLGRFLAADNLRFPELLHEEVDGAVYMRAITERALEGCSDKVLKSWKDRRWVVLRILGIKGEKDSERNWHQLELPGGTFVVSARAIDTAQNEAELAFLLLRPLIRSTVLKFKLPKFSPKTWAEEVKEHHEEIWTAVNRSQSLRDAEDLDAADELEVDKLTMQCISRGGYDSAAAISYLQHLSLAREETWSKPFFDHFIGFDYRLKRIGELRAEGIAKGEIKAGGTFNKKRYTAVAKLWNVLPVRNR